MKYIKYLLTSLIVLSFFACSGNRSDTMDTFEITGAVARQMNLEEVAADFSVVALKCDEPVSIGDVHSFSKDLFIVDDTYHTLWQFRDGCLVSRLSAFGRGHGEYDNLYKISYCVDDSLLFVYSANGQCFLKYQAPSMQFAGKVPCDLEIYRFVAVSPERIIAAGSEKRPECGLYSVDALSGQFEKTFDLNTTQADFCYFKYTRHSPFGVAVGLADYQNSIGWVDADGHFDEVFRFTFTDGRSKEMYRMKNKSTKFDDLIQISEYDLHEHFFDNAIFPCISGDDVTFWYCNNNAPAGDDSWLWLYRKSGNGILQAKQLTVPGLSRTIEPDGITDDGLYYSVLCGDVEMYEDADVEPSPLGKQILTALRSQNDENPVVLFYRII